MTKDEHIAGSEMEKNAIKNTPLGRAGQPQDIAKAAVFLAADLGLPELRFANMVWMPGGGGGTAGGASPAPTEAFDVVLRRKFTPAVSNHGARCGLGH